MNDNKLLNEAYSKQVVKEDIHDEFERAFHAYTKSSITPEDPLDNSARAIFAKGFQAGLQVGLRSAANDKMRRAGI